MVRGADPPPVPPSPGVLRTRGWPPVPSRRRVDPLGDRLLDEATAAPADLAALLIERSGREPERLAFRFLADGEQVADAFTYGELDRQARALAARLVALGAAGERVVLFHPPGLEYLTALFGCWYAGAVPVPAYPPRAGRHLPRLRSVVTDAQASFALTTAPVRQRLEAQIGADPVLARLRWVGDDPVEPLSREAVAAAPRPPGALALLQYTSGSTSAPKGVMLSHRNLLAHASELVAAFGGGSQDHEVSWLPPYHDMGLIGAIVAPLVAGCGATLMPPTAFLQSPLRWLEAVGTWGGTVTGAPDFAWDLCARRATPELVRSLDLRRLRVAFSGAERVRPETLERFAATFAPAGFRREAFLPCYGLAEATLGISCRPPGQGAAVQAFDEEALGRGLAEPGRDGAPARALAGSGRPLGSAEVLIVDPETRVPRADGEVGEIWARSAGVAQGYWNQPELSARTFGARLAGAPADGPAWLRTGDLGFLRDGELFVTGRLKDLMVLLGFNHYPEDIEATAAGAHPALRPHGGAAFSVEVGGEERLVVVHEVADPRQVPADEVAAALRGAIAEAHEVPVHEAVLVPPGGVPRTSSGKVQRSLCRERYQAGRLEALARSGRPAAPGAPPRETVERVAALMAAVLGVGRVGPEEDFFALGGHSLLATQLASRLREELGLELPLRAVFEAPTPLALAARLGSCAPARVPGGIPLVDRSRPLRLSFSQERMWYLHQLDPAGSAYNVAGALVVEGPLDVGLLSRALQAVIAGHEVFRTRYQAPEGVPQALLGPAPALEIQGEDLSGRQDPEAAAKELASDLAARPFVLEHGDLVRARVDRLGPGRHAVGLCAHHVVADGWSMGLLLGELLAAYAALAAGGEVPPRPPGPRYADYAAWQRDQLGPEATAAEVEHWRRGLAGAPLLELRTDRPRVASASRRGGLERLDLPAELWDRLRELARAEGATLYMVMLAAFEVLLHRHTGQTDLVVGTPIANRHRAAAEGLVGTLVNTVPVRVAVDPEASFRALLGNVREAALDAFAHQELPFERLVAALPVARRAGETPLFPVLFDFLNAPMPATRAGPLRLRPLDFSRRASQFDLSLSILDTAFGQKAGFEYRAELFDASTVRRLAGHYRGVLEAVAADPSLQVSRIPLLAATERAEILARAGDACRGRPADVPVPLLFEAQALRTPDAVAVVDGEGALTYRELLAASGELCARLRSLGAGPGQRVAVCLERSRAVPVALLAVLRAGAAYVPLDPRYPAERIAWVLEDAAPAVLLTGEAKRASMAVPAGTAVLALDAAPWPAAPVAPPGRPPGPDDTAYLIYTSGSTGRPKGVEVTHLGLSNFLASMGVAPGLSAADRLLSVTTISFDIAGLELFLPLVTGARVHLASAEEAADGGRLAALLRESCPTVMQATPATWRMLIGAGWAGQPGLRALCGGEALPRDLADQLLGRTAELWNLYGPTETTIWSSLWRVGPGTGPVPIGLPVAHNRLYVLDRHGQPAPVGAPGEIHIGGAGVARGYWRRPELTAERFVPDPWGGPGARMYRTGDLGLVRADGALEYLGRVDHQVKIRGHRVEPDEVAAVLREHPSVAAAAVVAREAGAGDLRLVAYYVARTDPGPGRAELREALRRRLPEHMVPAFLVQLEALPLTPNGKLDRNALPAPSHGHAVVAVARVAPGDALEQELAALFAEVLGTEVTSVHDGFFDLGGHSLLAARLFARLEQSTGVSLPLGVLFEHQTIDRLAALVRQRLAASAQVPSTHVVPIRAGGARAPFFCVHGAGGNVLNLQDLARYAAPDRPFLALQARGLDGREEPFGSIEEAAEAYLAEVRAVQPAGPYFLGGYCGGGLVAFAMAQELLAAGERVAVLALIDSPGPLLPPPVPRLRRWSQTLGKERLSDILRRLRAKWARDLGAVRKETAVRLHRATGQAVPHEVRDHWLTAEFIRSASRYRIRPYPGRLVLFRARDGSPPGQADLGWEPVAAGGLVVEEVPGDHHSLTREPHVRVLGTRLEAVLREAEEPDARRTAG